MSEKRLFRLTVIGVLAIISAACTQNPDKIKVEHEEEVKAISRVVDSCIGWAKNKDIKLFYSCIFNDPTFLSVRPSGGVVRGVEQLKSSEEFWMNPDFQYVKHDITNLTIRLSQSGDVAWFFCILNDRNTWKGKPAEWLNTRWTGVLEKREGNWVIMQQHFSFASE